MAEKTKEQEKRQKQETWQNREMYLERISKLRLMDDDFFSEALDGKIEAVEYILQTVLERDDLKVVETKAQVEYKSATKRSICLDIKAVDRNEEHFDIEIQRADAGTGPRRARFHGSMIDRELLDKGRNFEELPESFIIFITEDDKYDEGVPVYHIERKIEEKGNALFADGLHILYVNGEYQDVETPIGRLMHDFYCTRSEDMYSKILADEVKYLKETEGGRDRMCRILEEMCEEVAEEVAKETAERVEKETAERVEKEKAKETARLLLTLNKLSHEEISESTGLPLDMVEEMAAQKTA
ncbi:PD-(D/E)XK nuclease family transposase [Eubacterium sp. MSJ-33]|uniref:PD-(D/E)XK nuclease family transposase n=1 Tax=Eubacterium sp. MSJ-33 TaxID=2841528 RepID=UPI001C7889F3|nr:PD-(D/E)XK nuclease family transposase [Eubacterium sp. MSJ-33]QWT54142.1 PD-(D/E)XK nuclease family transposase [Eubacterium sp. MSJ-33]